MMLRALVLAIGAAVALGSNAEGIKFLEENAKKDGVITLPSGLQYKVLRSGDGDRWRHRLELTCSTSARNKIALTRELDSLPQPPDGRLQLRVPLRGPDGAGVPEGAQGRQV